MAFLYSLVYKNKIDFKKAIKLVEQKRLKSICSFIPAKTHPMSCWQVKKNKVSQFIKNDLCRRQDFLRLIHIIIIYVVLTLNI